ncbi:MAG: class I SAM-dependent methyltransferase [Draconibacterium sp.]
MIRNKEINFQSFKELELPQELSPAIRFLIQTLRTLKLGTASYKLGFYERFLNYLRLIGLTALAKNPNALDEINATGGTGDNSFVRFLIHLKVVTKQDGKWLINPKLNSLSKNQLVSVIENAPNIPDQKYNRYEQTLVEDFGFVRELIKKYRQPEAEFKHIKKHRKTWEKLIKTNQLDYEIRLSETLFHLWKFESDVKIPSPFDEAYYTESGRSAFRNFTRPLFKKYIRELAEPLQDPQIFDLGCGYGNYVELVRETFPGSKVTGVEINPKVCKVTREKFSADTNVEIINTNFFEFNSHTKYDYVLMNYVLFYFGRDNQKRVLKKAASLLKPNGSVILCQYFSGIELLKEQLAAKQNELTLFKKIVMHYSDKILYANTLWNDSVDTFASAVKWDLFLKDLTEAGLYINSVTNADPYYYSLFIEMKAK